MKKNVLLSLVFIFCTFSVCFAGQKNTKHHPIIDMHMHTFQWNRYGDPPPPNPITRKIPAARSDTEAIEAYVTEMDRYNIFLAVGFAQLEAVKKWTSYHPNRFIGGLQFPKNTAPVNTHIEEWPNINDLRKLCESGQIKIMGEITAQYAGVAPNDPKLEPYFALAEELDIPICFHTGFGPPMSPYRGDPEFRMRYGNPRKYRFRVINPQAGIRYCRGLCCLGKYPGVQYHE